ncbi:MAG: 2-amino-4-hydroxy-6-hydroxymethyldihydropteridine diphosphokinase [Chlamydiales bacterium]|nr:2-amino-4-hydroxy-6-hydroxymethyldihydropteridine diphosphokinase [Chlamydiales bacterium]
MDKIVSVADCYIGIGGNFPQTLSAMRLAVQKLSEIDEIGNLTASPLYRTTPVSPISQPAYLNAVCRFSCALSFEELWRRMQEIEKGLGKKEKSKQAPRLIDLDLLFFGEEVYHSSRLTLPHPKWHERLFVLAPLADLTDTLPFGIDLKKLMEKFSNPHNEQVEKCGLLI